MTLKELLRFFEGYYGEKYTGVFLDAMTAYLDGHSESYYQAIAAVLIKRFSRIYNKAPDPAMIEKNIDEINSMLPEPVYIQEPREEKATPEEMRMFVEQIKSKMKMLETGATARPFNNFINSIGN